jgi:hypothetical protein
MRNEVIILEEKLQKTRDKKRGLEEKIELKEL